MELDKRRMIISCIVIVLGLVVYAFRTWGLKGSGDEIVIETESAVSVPVTTVPESSSVLPSPVYICGAVNCPDIYEVELPVYLYELIDLAGGLSVDADKDKIDLVYRVDSPQSIYIPFYEETTEMTSREWNEFYSLLPTCWEETEEDTSSVGSVNINTAGVSELCTLPGIGEKTAEAIIAHREEHGPFSEGKDIMQVSGIGNAKYERIKDYISV